MFLPLSSTADALPNFTTWKLGHYLQFKVCLLHPSDWHFLVWNVFRKSQTRTVFKTSLLSYNNFSQMICCDLVFPSGPASPPGSSDHREERIVAPGAQFGKGLNPSSLHGSSPCVDPWIWSLSALSAGSPGGPPLRNHGIQEGAAAGLRAGQGGDAGSQGEDNTRHPLFSDPAPSLMTGVESASKEGIRELQNPAAADPGEEAEGEGGDSAGKSWIHESFCGKKKKISDSFSSCNLMWRTPRKRKSKGG